MSIFDSLDGMAGDLVARRGGTEAVLGGALRQAGGVEGVIGIAGPCPLPEDGGGTSRGAVGRGAAPLSGTERPHTLC